jgi:hypothetical protein
MHKGTKQEPYRLAVAEISQKSPALVYRADGGDDGKHLFSVYSEPDPNRLQESSSSLNGNPCRIGGMCGNLER